MQSARSKTLLICVISVLCVICGPDLNAQESQLGKVEFPTSGSEKAQAHFLRGVAALHSFWYEEALEAFRESTKVEPDFAMGYWGEAMAHNHPLWSEQDITAARQVLTKLKETPKLTDRERGYIAAVRALYGEGDKRARDAAYSAAMEKLYRAYPDDLEAASFYSLSLLGMIRGEDKSYRLQAKAGAIALDVYEKNPNHPGAAHYILHAYDHGSLAGKALPAARAYAKIAPAASHALHMPAHAFLQVGFWDDAAASDEASWNASIAWAKRRGLSIASRDYHSLAWLQYEWTQQGRFSKTKEAIALVNEAMKASSPQDLKPSSPLHSGGHGYGEQSEIGRGSGEAALRNDRGSMRARYIVESERWAEMKGQTTFDNIEELFALGLSAVHLRDAARVRAVIGEFRNAAAPGQAAELREQAEIMLREMEALNVFASGQHQAAFAILDQAATLQGRMPKPIGRPFPVMDVNELYGDLLLQVGRAKEAVGRFDRVLARTPNRSRALLGLARAYRNSGDATDARAAYKRFLTNYRLADPGLPEVAEARDAIR